MRVAVDTSVASVLILVTILSIASYIDIVIAGIPAANATTPRLQTYKGNWNR